MTGILRALSGTLAVEGRPRGKCGNGNPVDRLRPRRSDARPPTCRCVGVSIVRPLLIQPSENEDPLSERSSRGHDCRLLDRDAAPNGPNAERSDRASGPADEEISANDLARFEVELGTVPWTLDGRSGDRSLIERALSVAAECLEAVQPTPHIEHRHDAPAYRHPHRGAGRRNGCSCNGLRTRGFPETPVLVRQRLAPWRLHRFRHSASPCTLPRQGSWSDAGGEQELRHAHRIPSGSLRPH
jgi:hypothetical protein